MRGILSQLPDQDTIVGVREDARIAEQQFGNFQNVEEVQRAKAERRKFGRFFYRFPSGEAGLDVYSRVTSFMSTLYRDSRNIHRDGMDMDNFNLLIVTHGLTLRLMLMRWLQISVQDFEQMENPDNAFLAVMERQTSKEGRQWFQLTETSREHLNIPKVYCKGH